MQFCSYNFFRHDCISKHWMVNKSSQKVNNIVNSVNSYNSFNPFGHGVGNQNQTRRGVKKISVLLEIVPSKKQPLSQKTEERENSKI